ncbi:hypothetical protein ACFFRR_008350 [Megaselia abdita]
MFKYILVASLVCLVFGRPEGDLKEKNVDQIVHQDSEIKEDGTFAYQYETSNGIAAQAQGYLKTVTIPQYEGLDGKVVPQHEEQVLVQQGSYVYTNSEGQPINVTYVADENGFQPVGESIPKV